jgi:hydroxypyruvate reductase
MAGLATAADVGTLVINCISGGASALLPSPLDGASTAGLIGLSLQDKQRTTAALLGCGAAIGEINCVRKHLSGLKGGRLAALLHPARSLNFILSDVIGDHLADIASGITSPDPTTFADALEVIDRYHLRNQLPVQVIRALELGRQGRLAETPKPGDPVFATVDNLLIGSNRMALQAAADRARQLGCEVRVRDEPLCGEAREEGRRLAEEARRVALETDSGSRIICLLAGGETVVQVRGNGKGGRNQELALGFLARMAGWGEEQERVCLLSAATDGNDGPTDAAGAFADAAAVRRAAALGLDLGAHLADNDAYHFFEAAEALFKTGPTHTNVCDLQMVLVAPAAPTELQRRSY